MVVLVLSQSMERSLKICSKLEEQLHVCAPVQDIPDGGGALAQPEEVNSMKN